MTRLLASHDLSLNFRTPAGEMTPENGWNRYLSEATVAREPSGPPLDEGPFRRAQAALASYQFSDPSIVVGHFAADSRLLGRRMLLELKAPPALRFLTAVLVDDVCFEERDADTTFGFRYATLAGHIERGFEWFLLIKDHDSGQIQFRIEAAWQPGDFPNWWSRAGFRLVGPHFQRRWHHQAHRRLFSVAQGDLGAAPATDGFGTAHTGPDVSFRRVPRLRTVPEPIWHDDETIRRW
jgi:uncharacterized protein (UPF0548 family)